MKRLVRNSVSVFVVVLTAVSLAACPGGFGGNNDPLNSCNEHVNDIWDNWSGNYTPGGGGLAIAEVYLVNCSTTPAVVCWSGSTSYIGGSANAIVDPGDYTTLLVYSNGTEYLNVVWRNATHWNPTPTLMPILRTDSLEIPAGSLTVLQLLDKSDKSAEPDAIVSSK